MQFTLTLTVDATVADPATAPISVCLIKTGSSIHTGIGETNAPFCSTNENKEADSFFSQYLHTACYFKEIIQLPLSLFDKRRSVSMNVQFLLNYSFYYVKLRG